MLISCWFERIITNGQIYVTFTLLHSKVCRCAAWCASYIFTFLDLIVYYNWYVSHYQHKQITLLQIIFKFINYSCN